MRVARVASGFSWYPEEGNGVAGVDPAFRAAGKFVPRVVKDRAFAAEGGTAHDRLLARMSSCLQ
jgi:hypothetical protein